VQISDPRSNKSFVEIPTSFPPRHVARVKLEEEDLDVSDGEARIVEDGSRAFFLPTAIEAAGGENVK